MKYHFTYKTFCPITGDYYIGVHTTSRPYTDGYLGSGDWIRECKKARRHLIMGILNFFDSEDEAYEEEKRLVTWEAVHQDPLMRNKIIGGMGGWKGMTSELCAIRNKRDQTEAERQKRIQSMKAFYQVNAHHTTGKPKPPSQKLEMSKSQRGRTFSEESRRKMSETHKARYLTLEVKPTPPHQKGKKYNMKLMECPRCGFKGKGGNMTRYHFDKCRN